MPGPPPKPAARRQRSRRRMGVDIGMITTPGVAPSLPKGLCPAAKSAWENYWADPVSGALRASDSALALRWIRNVDRYHRLAAAADREPVVAGSTGQPRPSPLYELVFKLEASIREDERQLGVGPLSRLRLGIALAEQTKTLADLNAEAEADGGADDDPRLTLLQGVQDDVEDAAP